jgi:hypothetical protein
LEIGVCGEHGGDAVSVKRFFELGLDYVSASPWRLPIARLAAAQAAIEKRRSEAPQPTLRAWQTQLAFWVPTTFMLLVAGIGVRFGLPDRINHIAQAVLFPWVISGAGEVATVIALAGFGKAFGKRVVATPTQYNAKNPILLAHEGIGHTELGIRSEFLIRLLGPFLLVWALARRAQAYVRGLWHPTTVLPDLISFASAA